MEAINKLKIITMEKFRKTNALEYYKVYKDNQWKSTDKLVEVQENKLYELIKHACKQVPYYNELFKENRMSPDDIRTIDQLEKLPIVNKLTFKGNYEQMKALNITKFNPEEKRTGGSTGEPFKFYVTKESHSQVWANIWRGWNVMGFVPGDHIAVLAGSSLLSGFDIKRSIYYYLNNWEPFSSFNMSEEVMAKYVKKIQTKSINYLYAYSSSAYELAKYILKHNLNVKLKGVVTTAEILFPDYRQKIEEAFNCKVFNQYGANDGGITAYECNQHDGLHVGMERCIVEIVDEEGNRVPDGVEGKIILTDLSNFAMPFIRYDVGDFGAIHTKQCACGRGLIRLSHITGRQHEFIIANNDRKVHSGFFNQTLRNYDGIEQYQVLQYEEGIVNIKVKLVDEKFKDKLNLISEDLAQKGDLNEVNFEITNQFEKTKGGKHRFVINKLNQ